MLCTYVFRLYTIVTNSPKSILMSFEIFFFISSYFIFSLCFTLIGFKEKSNLTKHMIIHSGERPHTCDVCDASFKQLGHLLKHVLVHKPDKPFKCNVCAKGFKRKGHLKEHMVIHSGDFPFQCEFCQKKFRFKPNLKVHMMQHDGRKDYVCNVCDKAFTGKANLAQHVLVHDPDYKFTCDICKKTFRRKGHLKRHLEVHRSEVKLTCVFCKESCPDRVAYKKHLLTHTGSKPFACTVCGKRFGAKSYLQQHMLTHADQGGTFECDQCKKKFHSQEVLDKHIQQMHITTVLPDGFSSKANKNTQSPALKSLSGSSKLRGKQKKKLLKPKKPLVNGESIEIVTKKQNISSLDHLSTSSSSEQKPGQETSMNLPLQIENAVVIERTSTLHTVASPISPQHFESLKLPTIRENCTQQL